MKILDDSSNATTPHIFVRFSVQIVDNAFNNIIG